jgi:hypothetical protein
MSTKKIRLDATWKTRSGLLVLPSVAAKFADLIDENLKDPTRITKSSRRDPHGRCQLTRVNWANVLDEGLRIGGRAMTRDSRIEIGTRCTQVHVPAVEDRYILLAI